MNAKGKNDGGPAFPRPIGQRDGEYNKSQVGMSLRDYFAAHAPVEPQAWFFPVLPEKPEAPPDRPTLPEDFPDRAEDRNYITNLAWSWRRDPCFDLSMYVEDRPDENYRTHANALLAHAHPFLVEYETAWMTYWNAKGAYDKECNRQRFIQWPGTWADAMLAERAK